MWKNFMDFLEHWGDKSILVFLFLLVYATIVFDPGLKAETLEQIKGFAVGFSSALLLAMNLKRNTTQQNNTITESTVSQPVVATSPDSPITKS